MSRCTLIAACDEAGCIGRGGDLPWRLPGELRRFKAATMGKPLIVGRTTWESIGRPLPGRDMIVVTRQAGYRAEGVAVVDSIDAAFARAGDAGEVMIGGGGTIYAQTLARADRLLLTVVHTLVEGGDAFFPRFDLADWRVHAAEPVEEGTVPYTVYDLRTAVGGSEARVPVPLRRGKTRAL